VAKPSVVVGDRDCKIQLDGQTVLVSVAKNGFVAVKNMRRLIDALIKDHKRGRDPEPEV